MIVYQARSRGGDSGMASAARNNNGHWTEGKQEWSMDVGSVEETSGKRGSVPSTHLLWLMLHCRFVSRACPSSKKVCPLPSFEWPVSTLLLLTIWKTPSFVIREYPGRLLGDNAALREFFCWKNFPCFLKRSSIGKVRIPLFLLMSVPPCTFSIFVKKIKKNFYSLLLTDETVSYSLKLMVVCWVYFTD